MPLQAGGEFALVSQKLESALQLSGQPVKRGTMAHEHIVYMMLTDSAAQSYDVAAIKNYAPQLETLALRDGHQPYLAIAHRAWGVAHRLDGEYVEAENRLSQALALFEERDAHWQTGRTLYEMAELALARSDLTAAFDHFSRALSQFQELDAKPAVEKTLQVLANPQFATIG